MAKNRLAKSTYYISAQAAGPSGGGPSGSNKAMLSLLNPASSGKKLSVLVAEYFPLSSSGTDVFIDVQIRRITAHSGGTSLTVIKRELTDASSVAEARSEPSVTGGAASDLVQQLVIQSNSPATGEAYRFKLGLVYAHGEKPIVLAEGEGIVIHQVTSNGGDFAPGLVWIEE